MCTIVFAWKWSQSAPLILAANRDELVSRPSEPPSLLQERPPLWGGRDVLAGGTWLAVDPRGRVCAVTNRHPGGRLPERDPARRSRGVLPTAVLGAGANDRAAVGAMEALQPADFNPVNALYLSPATAFWVGMDDEGGFQASLLTPGIHVLTELNPDDPTSIKSQSLLESATAVASSTTDPHVLLAGLRTLLQSHDRTADGPESAACIHAAEFGTVSSATVLVTSAGVSFDHAEGHPCVTEFDPVLSDAG